jgi:glycosyltransferase involved in cell wall biosynthesis
MRIGIDARVLAFCDCPTGLYQYTYNLVNALQEIDSSNEYVLLFNAFRKRYRKYVKEYTFNRNFLKKNCALPGRVLDIMFHKVKLPIDFYLGSVDVFHGPSFELLPGISGKAVVTIHDLMFLSNPGLLPEKTVEIFNYRLKRSLQKADRFIAVSEFTKSELQDRCNIPSSRISVVYNGVGREFSTIKSAEKAGALREKFGIKNRYLLYFGNVEPKKNIMRIIEAFNILKNSERIEHDLVIAGRKSYADYYEKLIKRIRELGLKGRVFFTGTVHPYEAPLLYKGADVFIFPSLYEGFGIPVLEAMACGIPVVASNIAPIKEVCGDAAILVNPLNSEETASGMLSVLSDSSVKDRLIKAGLARVSGFTWEKTAKNTLSIYEDLL